MTIGSIHRHRLHLRCRQRGIAAIEFAIVFPVFFLLFYGIVTFALIFLAQSSLTLGAEEGARSALRFQPATSQAVALSTRSATACSTANSLVTWLPGSGGGSSSVSCSVTTLACTYDATLLCMKVSLAFNYFGHPIVPTLPFVGLILPANLYGSSVVQLNPINLTSN